MAGWVHNANAAVARSFVGRYFRLEGSGHVRVFQDDMQLLANMCVAQGTQGKLLLHRVPCRSGHLLRHGLHYLCQL
jgi:hypothetical protein